MTDPKQVEDLAAPIKDAFYTARDAGRTMHQAADDAARALLADGWVHHDTLPYVACDCGRKIYLPATDPDIGTRISGLAALADRMETDGYAADSDGWGHVAAREIRHELGLEPECRCPWNTEQENTP